MANLFNLVSQWLSDNNTFVALISVGSAMLFVATIVAVPWLVTRIPTDYFCDSNHDKSNFLGDHPIAILIVKFIRNILALLLIAMGILMLVLPGQGLLTIVFGFIVADFPKKHRLIQWLASKDRIFNSINWLRRKMGKTELLRNN